MNSHEDEGNTASHAVKSKDADIESTDVDHNEAEDIDNTRNDRDNKADKISSSKRTKDPKKLDGRSSKTTNCNELDHPKVPTGTRSTIISKDLIIGRGVDVIGSDALVLYGDMDDDGPAADGAAIQLPITPARAHEGYFHRSPLDVRHKSPCAAIPDQT